MHYLKLFYPVLTLFDGGAAAGGAAGASTGDGQGAGTAQAGANGSAASSQRPTGEKQKVVYGKQTENAALDAGEQPNKSGITTTTKTDEERKAAFEKIISGDYKDLFTARVQGIIDKRFKETKSLETQLKAHQEIADVLRMKYGVDDPVKLKAAIEKDDAYWEAAAEEAGLTVEQYRQMKKIEAENTELKRQQVDAEATAAANKQYAEWMHDAEDMKGEYPDFDLQGECQNPQFIALLRSGVDMKAAYTAIHYDAVKQQIAKTTAKTVETNVVNNIRARGMRPPENGASSQPGIIVKSDVHNLTKSDRAEIARRVARGEHISF